MAAAGAARCVPVLLLLGVLSARRVPVPLLLLGVLSAAPRPDAQASEHYTPLSLLKQELQHRQQQEAPAGGGCSPQSGDWGDQHSAECAGECAARRGSAGPAGPRGLRVPQVPPTPARRVLPARQPRGVCHPGPLPASRARSRCGGGGEGKSCLALPGPARPPGALAAVGGGDGAWPGTRVPAGAWSKGGADGQRRAQGQLRGRPARAGL